MAAEDWAKGLVIGGLIGIAIGILYAPKSGKETREDIAKSMDELREKSKQQIEEARIKMDELASRSKEIYKEQKEKINKALESIAKEAKEKKAAEVS